MSYKFNFDLSNFSQSFFREIVKMSYRSKIHKKVGEKARYLVEKFKVDKFTGLPVEDAISVVEDFIDRWVGRGGRGATRRRLRPSKWSRLCGGIRR